MQQHCWLDCIRSALAGHEWETSSELDLNSGRNWYWKRTAMARIRLEIISGQIAAWNRSSTERISLSISRWRAQQWRRATLGSDWDSSPSLIDYCLQPCVVYWYKLLFLEEKLFSEWASTRTCKSESSIMACYLGIEGLRGDEMALPGINILVNLKFEFQKEWELTGIWKAQTILIQERVITEPVKKLEN